MPRQKLTPRRRDALRRELQVGLAQHGPSADLTRRMAKKYGVSRVAIRWYLKNLDPVAPGGHRNGASGPVTPADLRDSGLTRLPKILSTRGGASIGLLDVVRHFSAERLARALEAKRLFSELQETLAEQRRLRETERQVRKSLEALSKSARALERRLEKLATS